MAHRTNRLGLRVEDRENNLPTTTRLLNLPGKAIAKPIVQTRRAALGDVGNKATHTNGATINLKKTAETITVKALKTTTTTTTTKTTRRTTALQETATKPIIKRQESVLARRTIRELAPIVPKAEESYSSKKLDVIDPDAKDGNNPLLVTEYILDIFAYLKEMEKKYPINEAFLTKHSSTPRMRSVLVNWLVEVHTNFHLLQETLHLTVNTVDRYLQQNPKVGRETLQLVGITGMFIASKYEEMYVPDLQDFVYVCDNSFSKRELLRMEMEMLRQLDYSFGRPLSIHFLRRFSKVGSVTTVQHNFGKYLLELALLEYEVCHVAPSLQAAAAVCLVLSLVNANAVMNPATVWNKTLAHYSGYEYGDIKSTVVKMACVLSKAETSKFQQIRTKYANSKFSKVSQRLEIKGALMKKLTSLV